MCRLLLASLLAFSPLTLADPMRPDPAPVSVSPARSETPAEPQLVLSSIYILAEQRFAVINGQWLDQGATINNYRISQIRSDQVDLVRGNQRRTLDLQSQGEFTITHREE